jgi:hypothetical protein
MEAWRLKMEPWRFYRSVVADSHHFEAVLRIRIRIRIPIQVFLGLLMDPDPLVRGMNPDPTPDPNPDPLVRGIDPRIPYRSGSGSTT